MKSFGKLSTWTCFAWKQRCRTLQEKVIPCCAAKKKAIMEWSPENAERSSTTVAESLPNDDDDDDYDEDEKQVSSSISRKRRLVQKPRAEMDSLARL